MKVNEVIVLAGGLGLRLRGVVRDVPKVMADVNGRPFLSYILDYLGENGFTYAILSVGYKYETIKKYFQEEYKNIKIDYAVEDEPLGTGGAIKRSFELVKGSNAMVINGDTMFRVNYKSFIDFHNEKDSGFSLLLREVDNVERFGSVETDNEDRIVDFSEKGKKSGKGEINGGIYLIDKSFFDKWTFPEKFSIEKEGFEKLYKIYKFYAKVSPGYFIDIGIPEDYIKAQNEFEKFKY